MEPLHVIEVEGKYFIELDSLVAFLVGSVSTGQMTEEWEKAFHALATGLTAQVHSLS